MSYRHPRYHPQEGPTGVFVVLTFALSLPAVVIILGTAIAANSPQTQTPQSLERLTK